MTVGSNCFCVKTLVLWPMAVQQTARQLVESSKVSENLRWWGQPQSCKPTEQTQLNVQRSSDKQFIKLVHSRLITSVSMMSEARGSQWIREGFAIWWHQIKKIQELIFFFFVVCGNIVTGIPVKVRNFRKNFTYSPASCCPSCCYPVVLCVLGKARLHSQFKMAVFPLYA